MSTTTNSTVSSVYGPVKSWRYGCSLGIDPIGLVSTCSFNCVYCQLGEIEVKTQERQVFIPTAQILQDLDSFAPWVVDVITLSGSGEPTQALNLGEILEAVKQRTGRPTLVLTNGTLLKDQAVCSALHLADKVSVKLDAVLPDQWRRINRPVSGINLADILGGLQQFQQEYPGELGLQTMVLSPWSTETKAAYIELVKPLKLTEIQLNTPTRPKPLSRQLDGRGNHSAADRPYPVQVLKCLDAVALHQLATEIQQATGVSVRCAPV